MDFESRMWHFYRAICLSIEDTFAPLLVEEELSPQQARILFVLSEEGSLSVGELSMMIRMNAGNCSTMCKELETRDLLLRERKRDDQRVVVLRLSEQGGALVSRVFKHAQHRHKQCLSAISEEERKNILTQLGKLEDLLVELRKSCLVQQEEKNGK